MRLTVASHILGKHRKGVEPLTVEGAFYRPALGRTSRPCLRNRGVRTTLTMILQTGEAGRMKEVCVMIV